MVKRYLKNDVEIFKIITSDYNECESLNNFLIIRIEDNPKNINQSAMFLEDLKKDEYLKEKNFLINDRNWRQQDEKNRFFTAVLEMNLDQFEFYLTNFYFEKKYFDTIEIVEDFYDNLFI